MLDFKKIIYLTISFALATQEKSFCELIASTNIESIYGSVLGCTSTYPNSDICNGLWSEIGLVSCSNATIVSINFQRLSLHGTLPTSLGNITTITYLDFSYNSLSGSIPSSFGKLTNLYYLLLNSNSFSSTIPSSLGRLEKLTFLYFHSNVLTGTLPSALSQLTNLIFLDANSNKLTGSLPTEYGQLTNLKYLYTYSNKLSHKIPSSLGNLTNLLILQLQYNQFTNSIPTVLGNLTNLYYIFLFRNSLTSTIPSSFGLLNNTISLSLYDNFLTGTIPTTLGLLTKLNYLYLGGNKLTGTIPTSLNKLIYLQYIDLGENKLTSTIPSSIFTINSLVSISFWNNKLTGTLPNDLSDVTNLQYLHCGSNKLTGSIPSSIGYLTQLQYLYLFSNKLKGTLPTSFGFLQNVTEFVLPDNQLSGTIPTSLAQLNSMTQFYIGINSFTGTIPTAFGQLSQLEHFQVNTCHLSGEIPTALGQLVALTSFILYGNSLSGSIPTALGALKALCGLIMNRNRLTGSIPTTLSSLTKLRLLYLGDNFLTGTLPTLLSELTALITLSLGNNMLSGTIPTVIASLESLAILSLQNNFLTGFISQEFFYSAFYYSFELQKNKLSGTIPGEIMSQILLNYLSLAYNKLSGTIAATFGIMFALEFLDLSSNSLTGTLPSLLVGLSLETLDLADNLLTGSVPSTFCDSILNQLTFDNNDGIGCYASCLDSLPALGQGFTTDCDTGSVLCDIVAGTNAAAVLDGWRCSKDAIPVTSVCGGSWKGITCSITKTVNVVKLVIPSSLLNGTLPSSLGSLVSVTALDVSSNSLYGTIPRSIGNLTKLASLFGGKNYFSGSIPSELGYLSKLTVMSLQSNHLTGSIPYHISGIYMTTLDLSSNSLEGSVPSTLCSKFLSSLSFSNNSALGCYSSCLSSLASLSYGLVTNCDVSAILCGVTAATNIESKRIGWNCSSASIPATSVCSGSWRHVQCRNSLVVDLQLGSLSLSGSLPSVITKLTSLQYLDFSNNQMHGVIPNKIGSLLSLSVLSLHTNSISGSVPPTISLLSSLEVLQLQRNLLHGTIPSGLAGSLLSYLDLSANSFNGSIPTTLCAKDYLVDLNINNNSKLDCYPNCLTKINKFTHSLALESCDISTTSLSDSLSVTVFIIIIVSACCFCCFCLFGFSMAFKEILYRLGCRERPVTFVTAAHDASMSIQRVVVDSDKIADISPDRTLHKGLLFLKSNEVEEGIAVDVIISRNSQELKSNYEVLFELHEVAPSYFAKTHGLVSSQRIEYVHDDWSLKSMELNHGVVIETSESALSAASDLLDYRYQSNIGHVAQAVVTVVTTALKQGVVLHRLSYSQLLVFPGEVIKLADISGSAKLGELMSVNTRQVRLSLPLSQNQSPQSQSQNQNPFQSQLASLIPDFQRYDDVNGLCTLTPEIASVHVQQEVSSGGGGGDAKYPLDGSYMMWVLGIKLFELLSGRTFSDFLPKLNVTLHQSIAALTQEDVDLMVERYCSGSRQTLRREALKLLLRINPLDRPSVTDSLTLSDKYFETKDEPTLHFFIRRKVPDIYIQDLLGEYPYYATMKDTKDYLPVHYSLAVEADASLLSLLLEAYPDACKVRYPEESQQWTLLQYALEKNLSEQHVQVLLPYFMPIDSLGAALPVEEHGYGWIKVLSHLNPPDKYVEVVSTLLKQYSPHIKSLAYQTDELGRSAFNIATPKCKKEIIKILYFLGTYDIKPEVAHHSKTCIVRLATDTKNNRAVVLKFMKFKDQFRREVNVREQGNFSDQYVLGFLEALDSDVDAVLREELHSKGYVEYKYVLVMVEAERTLQSIIAHENIAGNDWDKIRSLCTQLLQAVRHVHSAGLIHGDVKPLNIMRVQGRLKLIDMDACVGYKGGCRQFAGAKYSSAYIPPEMIDVAPPADRTRKPRVRTYDTDENLEPILSGLTYSLLPAHPSYDMWALGVTMYQLCTGKPFSLIDNQDNVDHKTLLATADWTDAHKAEVLSVVTDTQAYNLLSQLLHKDPERRPSADRALSHPFLTGKVAARMPGEVPEFDVFISYRVASDAQHVEEIYSRLTSRNIKVWWDRVCLEDGKPWEEGFCNGLAKCMAFVPILSREAINSDFFPQRQNFSNLAADSPCDNVLLEYRLAIEMRAMTLVELVYPIMIGDNIDGIYTNYFASKCHPKLNDITVNAVEEKVKENLDKLGLGAPIAGITSVAAIVGEILKNQGGFVEGHKGAALNALVDKIVHMVQKRKRGNNESLKQRVSAITRFRMAVQKIIELNKFAKTADIVFQTSHETLKQQVLELKQQNHHLYEENEKLKCSLFKV